EADGRPSSRPSAGISQKFSERRKSFAAPRHISLKANGSAIQRAGHGMRRSSNTWGQRSTRQSAFSPKSFAGARLTWRRRSGLVRSAVGSGTPRPENASGHDADTFKPTKVNTQRFIHREDLPFVEATLQKAVREKSEFEVEYRIIRPDGSIRYHRGIGRPLETANGGLELIGMVVDVTER